MDAISSVSMSHLRPLTSCVGGTHDPDCFTIETAHIVVSQLVLTVAHLCICMHEDLFMGGKLPYYP